MGCTCIGDRAKDEELPKETPETQLVPTESKTPRTKKRAKKRSPNESTPLSTSEGVTERVTSQSIEASVRSAAVVRKLQQPLSELYQLDRAPLSSQFGHLTKATEVASGQPCFVLRRRVKEVKQSQQEKGREWWHHWSALDHPNVLKPLELLQDDKFEYFVFEYYTGGDADIFLKKNGPLGEAQAMRVMYNIFSVLNYIHSKNLAVRNLSLSNVSFTLTPSECSLKVGFFTEIGEIGAGKPLSSAARLSPFLSLETRAGQCCSESDMWSCGVMLHCLITGSSPFLETGSQKDLEDSMAHKTLLKSPRWGVVSEETKNLVIALLHPSPERRPKVADCLAAQCVLSNANRESLGTTEIRKILKTLAPTTSRSPLKKIVFSLLISRLPPKSALSRVSDLFSALDTDMDGYVSNEELLTGLRLVYSEAQAQSLAAAIMASADTNHSGRLDYSEFLQCSTLCESQLLTKKNLWAVFVTFDKDGSGAISVEELKDALVLKEQSQNSLWVTLLQDADADHDGVVSYKEFEKIMLDGAH